MQKDTHAVKCSVYTFVLAALNVFFSFLLLTQLLLLCLVWQNYQNRFKSLVVVFPHSLCSIQDDADGHADREEHMCTCSSVYTATTLVEAERESVQIDSGLFRDH